MSDLNNSFHVSDEQILTILQAIDNGDDSEVEFLVEDNGEFHDEMENIYDEVAECPQDVNNHSDRPTTDYFEDEVDENQLNMNRTDTLAILAETRPFTSSNSTTQISENPTLYTSMTSKDTAKEYFVNQDLTPKENIRWLKGLYLTQPIEFYEPPPTDNTYCLPSPISFFENYFTDDLITKFVENTNLYAVQNNVANFPTTTKQEIKTFIGVQILMGVIDFPRVSRGKCRTLVISVPWTYTHYRAICRVRTEIIHAVCCLATRDDCDTS